MSIAKGTPPWIFLVPTISVIFLVLSIFLKEVQSSLFAIGIMIFILFFPVILFFRDPDRTIGKGVVSPADGKVMFVEKNDRGKEWHIGIFMSPLDVHVNRAPVAGKVIEIEHLEGNFKPAYNRNSKHNERVIITLYTDMGNIKIIQIAGILARRIVPYVDKGHLLSKGQRIGIIRFGSRVDVFLPSAIVEPVVVPGQRVKAGTDSIAVIREKGKL